MSESQRFQPGTIGALSLSVVSSVSIVICNKALISTLGFIFVCLLVNQNYLQYGCLTWIAFFLPILLSNLLLLIMLSTGGFSFDDQYHSEEVQGILNPTSVSALPLSGNDLFTVDPFLDWLLMDENVFSFNFTPQVLIFIVLSCLISVSVNFGTFLVIGKTSPVTYQVLGHLKICLFLAFGYVLLCDLFSWRNILGILIAVVGMIPYSYIALLRASRRPVKHQHICPRQRKLKKILYTC